jgi:uncharacterized damage-inducible protein DinB
MGLSWQPATGIDGDGSPAESWQRAAGRLELPFRRGRRKGTIVGMKGYFTQLAQYNRWANAQLFGAVGQLDAPAFQAPRSGFFGSLCATLNHLYVGDRCWLARFEQIPVPHRQLDEIPHPLFAHLWAARQVEDARIIRLIEQATDSWFSGTLRYTRMADGVAATLPMDMAIGHFFNHQTHHRGQAHAMLSSTQVAPPPLDLAYLIAQQEADRTLSP